MVAWGRMGCPYHGPVLGRNGAVGGGLSRVSAGPDVAIPQRAIGSTVGIAQSVTRKLSSNGLVYIRRCGIALVACKLRLLKCFMLSTGRVSPTAALLLSTVLLLTFGMHQSLASGWEPTVDADSYDVTVEADDGTVLFLACLTSGRTKGGAVILDLPEKSEPAEVGEVYPISFVTDGRTVPFAMTFDGEKLMFSAGSAEEYFLWSLLLPDIAKATRLSVASPDLGFSHEIPTENAETVQKEMFKACDVD